MNNQYFSTRVRQSYSVKSHCPSCVGQVLGVLRIPGFKSQEVVLKYHYTDEKDPASLENIDVLQKDWAGTWSTTQINPPVGFNSNSCRDADLLIKDFM